MYMKTVKFFATVLLLLGGASVLSVKAKTAEDMSDNREISPVVQQKKLTPEERMEKKITAKVNAVADSVGLTDVEKKFLFDNWISQEKEVAEVGKKIKNPEEQKAARSELYDKYDGKLIEHFGKERAREIIIAAKAYNKSLKAKK